MLFLIAGGIATAMHYALLIVLVALLAADPVAASIAGSVLGAFVSYIINYKITFKSTKRHQVALSRFLLVATIGLGLNAGILALAVEHFNIHYLVGQVVATCVVLCWNFVVNRLWSF